MTTVLTNGITFQSMIKQLSKDEFLTLMGKLYDMNHSNLIATSLFNYFMHQKSIENANTNDFNNINFILSEIIQSRKPKAKQETSPSTPIKLDIIPKALIGHIASYLQQNDYFRFQKTNRTIFIGCNSPNKLVTLDIINVMYYHYSSINLQQFKSLKTLHISLPKFDELKLPQNGQYIMNELENLELHGNFLKNFDIEPFMNQNCINIENIKSVIFSRFGKTGVNGRFNNDQFVKLLFKFKNIQSLELRGVIPNTPIPRETLQQLYDLHPLLHGLIVDGGYASMNNDLINIFGNKLRFLLHGNRPHRNIDFSNINFINLEQVMLVTPAAKTVNDILKSAKNIRKFGIFPDGGCDSNSSSPEELKTIIPQIFKCELLQYFQIEINNQNYLQIFDAIEKGIFETKTIKRKQISIRIQPHSSLQIDLNSIIINIGRIIKWLQSPQINDFMFIYDMKYVNINQIKSLDSEKILKEFNEISSNIQAQSYETCFVITNHNCKICGFIVLGEMPLNY